MRNIIASFKIFIFILHCIWIFPTQGLVLLLAPKSRLASTLPRIWHSIVLKIFSIKVETNAPKAKELLQTQSLFMSNHLSYLDICVLGSLIEGSFVAKSEVESWPLFGLLSKLQRTSFIVRSRENISAQKNALQNRINEGDSLIIFPEGTSTDGRSVIPFKSSLFSLVTGKNNLMIQPITIDILQVSKQSSNAQNIRDFYAWHGDMTLTPHIWALAKQSGATVRVTFHPPLKSSDYNNRKTLAKETYEAVSLGLKRIENERVKPS